MWAGSGIIRRDVLQDFLQFALKMYEPAYLPVLKYKKYKAPFVCDMTLWYLYVAQSEMGAAWGLRTELLPPAKQFHFCDGEALGYDRSHGYRTDTTLKSYHFQGPAKYEVHRFINGTLRASS